VGKPLEETAHRLVQLKPERTLSDFPLLPLTYNGISNLLENLPQLGVSSLEEVEDVYPCPPMQQGLLLAQVKNPDLYAYESIFRVRSTDPGYVVDTRLLSMAWKSVIRRHAALRTIFMSDVCGEGMISQVVFEGD
jgi:hypothetical protein